VVKFPFFSSLQVGSLFFPVLLIYPLRKIHSELTGDGRSFVNLKTNNERLFLFCSPISSFLSSADLYEAAP